MVSERVAGLVSRIRKHTNLPVLVGFGVSKREHIQEISRFADGLLKAIAQERVVVPHEDQRGVPIVLAHLADGVEAYLVVDSLLQRVEARLLDRRSFGEGIAERHSKLKHIRAYIQDGVGDIYGRVDAREADGHEWGKGEPAGVAGRFESGVDSVSHGCCTGSSNLREVKNRHRHLTTNAGEFEERKNPKPFEIRK